MTGIPSGDSSAVTTFTEALSAATILLSGRWKAGLRFEMMFGVRTRTEGFGGGDFVEETGPVWSSGRKD